MKYQMVFVYQNFFEERDYKRFGIDIFKKNNIEVKIWSIIYLCAQRKSISPIQEICQKEEVFYPKSRKELDKKIISSSNMQFLLFINYGKENWIRKKIIKEKCTYYELRIGTPLNYGEQILSKNIINKTKYQLYFERMLNRKVYGLHIFKKFFILFLYQIIETDFEFLIQSMLYPPKYYFFSVNSDKNHVPILLRRKRKSIYIHCLNYDEYLRVNSVVPEINNKNYIVYVDGGELNIHPDVVLLGMLDSIKGAKKELQKELICLFEKLEKQYNCNIIILGHPRVVYQGDEFGNRKIVSFHTAEFIKYAKLVIISNSTAWDYVMLYNKLVLFWWSDLMINIEEKYAWIDYLKMKPYNTSNNNLQIDKYIRKISKKIKIKYINDYIMGENSKDINFFEILIDIVKKNI